MLDNVQAPPVSISQVGIVCMYTKRPLASVTAPVWDSCVLAFVNVPPVKADAILKVVSSVVVNVAVTAPFWNNVPIFCSLVVTILLVVLPIGLTKKS